MATTLEGLGIDLGTDLKVAEPTGFFSAIEARTTEAFNRERQTPEGLLRNLPPQLLEAFNRIAKEGIFSEEDMAELLRLVSEAEGQRRSKFARAAKKTVGRRLGPRSGEVNRFVANQVVAPSFEREADFDRKLRQTNFASRFTGLQGIGDLLEFFQNQVGLDEELRRSRQGPGFLDFVDPALQIGGAIFGGPAGAAAGSAVGGALNNPRGGV